MVVFLNLILIITGLLLLLMSFFLYENEEKHVAKTLENIWLTIDDKIPVVKQKAYLIIQNSVNLTSWLLDKLFGESRVSLRFFLNSIILSFSSFIIMIMMIQLSEREIWYPDEEKFIADGYWFLLVGIVLVLIVILQNCSRFFYFLSIALAFFIVLIWCFMVATYNPNPRAILDFSKYGVAGILSTGFGVITDSISIIVVRSFLKRSIVLKEFKSTLFAVCTVITISTLFFIVPVGLTHNASYKTSTGSADIEWLYELNYFSLYCFSSMTNLFSTVPLISLMVFSFISFLVISFPTLINRIVYSVQRFGIFSNRKLIATIGALFLLWGLGNWSPTLKVILNIFGVDI